MTENTTELGVFVTTKSDKSAGELIRELESLEDIKNASFIREDKR